MDLSLEISRDTLPVETGVVEEEESLLIVTTPAPVGDGGVESSEPEGTTGNYDVSAVCRDPSACAGCLLMWRSQLPFQTISRCEVLHEALPILTLGWEVGPVQWFIGAQWGWGPFNSYPNACAKEIALLLSICRNHLFLT